MKKYIHENIVLIMLVSIIFLRFIYTALLSDSFGSPNTFKLYLLICTFIFLIANLFINKQKYFNTFYFKSLSIILLIIITILMFSLPDGFDSHTIA